MNPQSGAAGVVVEHSLGEGQHRRLGAPELDEEAPQPAQFVEVVRPRLDEAAHAETHAAAQRDICHQARAFAQHAVPLHHAIRPHLYVLGEDDPRVATVYNNLAGVYRDRGELDRAESAYRQALALAEDTAVADAPPQTMVLLIANDEAGANPSAVVPSIAAGVYRIRYGHGGGTPTRSGSR